MVSFLDAAADLVPLGFKVFPLVPGQKLPLIKAWQKAASDDLEAITEWSARWPDANIGVATGEPSGVVVVDVDVKDGRNGVEDLASLAKSGKSLPPCPISLTPTGGRHLFFRMASGLRNVAGITAAGRGLARGIDVRAAGGFVVVPPSALKEGLYRWLLPPMTPEFPRLPDWALKMLSPPTRPAPAFTPDVRGGDIEPLARFIAGSPQGERNNRLYWAACRTRELVAKRIVSEASAMRRLSEVAAAVGLPGPEALRTILSAFHKCVLK